MRARIIYNPTAGHELFKRQLAECLNILEEHGIETSTFSTRGPGDAEKEAMRIAELGKHDIVIASGGDGTVKEVIAGLARAAVSPKLGIIPSGTVNDMALSLKLPANFAECTRIIAAGKTKQLDVIKADDEIFMNVAACGMFTEVSYKARSRMKTLLGKLAYYLKGIESIPNIRYIPLEVESPDGCFSGDALFIMLANSGSVGGNVLCPLADPCDGKIDVTIVPKMAVNELVQLGGMLLAGRQLEHPRVIHFATTECRLSSPAEVSLNLDGEFGGYLPKTFKVMPQRIEVFVP